LRKKQLADPVSTYRAIEVSSERWVFSSGPLRVHANFSPESVEYAPVGTALLSSRTITVQEGRTLAPWEAIVTRAR
jgi:hypothetical protein